MIMHKTERYIDLRIVFTHSFEHGIPHLVFNLISLEKKFGAIVSWVLNGFFRCFHHAKVVHGGQKQILPGTFDCVFAYEEILLLTAPSFRERQLNYTTNHHVRWER